VTDDERKRYDDDVEFRNAACEHGSQRRKCNICELFCEQHDNAALRARIEVLEKVVEAGEGIVWEQVGKYNYMEGSVIYEHLGALRAALDALKEG